MIRADWAGRSIEAQRGRLPATRQDRNPLVLWVACLAPCPFCAAFSKDYATLTGLVKAIGNY